MSLGSLAAAHQSGVACIGQQSAAPARASRSLHRPVRSQATQQQQLDRASSSNGASPAPRSLSPLPGTSFTVQEAEHAQQAATPQRQQKPLQFALQAQATGPNPRLNYIPKTRWQRGIPPVMGAHLMASGEVAPISTSKGAGIGGVPHLFSYPDKESETQVLQFANERTGTAGVAAVVADAAKAAIAAKGSFTLVLSGGSLFKALAGLIGLKDVDFAKWHVLFVDERNVPHSSPDSNFRGADEAFLSKVPIPRSQILAIREGLPVTEAAREYEGRMLALPQSVLPRTEAGWPVLDLILLGLGPDGHIASLFPNRRQTAATTGWVLPVEDSPKPPPERITMTLPVINAAKDIAFVAFGEGKAEIVQRVLEVQSLPGALPAQLVRPTSPGGRLRWLLDAAAAQHLAIEKWAEAKAFPRSGGGASD